MSSRDSKTRLLIVDDHALFREGIARLLKTEPDFEIIAECESVSDALQIISQTQVDLVLLDYDLGANTALPFFAEARRIGFQGKALIVTAGLSELEGAELMRQGAAGIFMKHGSAAALSQGVRQVMGGQVWCEQQYLRSIFDVPLPRIAAQSQGVRLSDRERQILHGILEGQSNKQIALRLEMSESSVKAALQQLFDKTGVRTRSQLVRIALEQFRDQL